jgi:hypothetical protein
VHHVDRRFYEQGESAHGYTPSETSYNNVFPCGLTFIAGISCIRANPAAAEPSTVLLDKAELARAKENIRIEPLKSISSACHVVTAVRRLLWPIC